MGGVLYSDTATGPSAFLKPLTDSTAMMQNIPLNLSAKPNRRRIRCKSPTEETPRKKRCTRLHAHSSMHLRSSGVLMYTNALKNKPHKPKVSGGKNPKGEAGGKPKGGGGRKPKHRECKPKNLRKPKQSETETSLDETEENVPKLEQSLDKTEDNVVPKLEHSLDKTEDNAVTQTEETPVVDPQLGPSDLKKCTAAPTNLQEPNILDGHLSKDSGL